MEILDGERVPRISGSYRYCFHVALDMIACGFTVEIVPYIGGRPVKKKKEGTGADETRPTREDVLHLAEGIRLCGLVLSNEHVPAAFIRAVLEGRQEFPDAPDVPEAEMENLFVWLLSLERNLRLLHMILLGLVAVKFQAGDIWFCLTEAGERAGVGLPPDPRGNGHDTDR